MKRKLNTLLVILLVTSISYAQMPIDGFMKKKGSGSVTVSHSYEDYDEVFLVPNKVDRVPVFDEVEINATTLYAVYGVTDDINVVVNLPYISTQGYASAASQENNGFENERSGFQDVGIYSKFRAFTLNTKEGRINLIGSLGVELPVGGYDVDEGLQSIIAIGNRSTDINAIGIANYKHDSGFFVTGQTGYSLRSNDVPNAFLNQLKIGYAAGSFYLDGFIANQISEDGVDILGEGFTGFFPATQVNFTRVGLNVFVPVVSQFGVSAGANTYVAGRNLGQSTGFYGGLTYSF